MTKLTNEELLTVLRVAKVTLANWSREPELNSLATYIDDTIYQAERMAEGAAGEAAPQGDLLAALKFYMAICGNTAYQVSRQSAQEAYVQAQAAIENYESGSASTAGPRPDGPRCPKCSEVYCKRVTIRKVPGDTIQYRDDGWTEGVECLGCRHRGLKAEFFKVETVTAGPRDTEKLFGEWAGNGPIFTRFGPPTYREKHMAIEFAEFFAAAPAEDAKEKL